jgi:hypothetical protein
LTQIKAPQNLWDHIFQKDPEGINRLDEKNFTPLDYAMDQFVIQGNAIPFQRLMTLGAFITNTSLFKMHQALKTSSDNNLLNQFQVLKRQAGGKGDWEITLGEVFPRYQNGIDLPIIMGSSLGRRCLLPEVKSQLEDENRKTDSGRRKVIKVDYNNQQVYVKYYPGLPGLEEAVGILTREIIGWEPLTESYSDWIQDNLFGFLKVFREKPCKKLCLMLQTD